MTAGTISRGQAGENMKDIRGLRPALFVAGILCASLAESSGPVWILAAAGGLACFAALLVIGLRCESARLAVEEEERRFAGEINIFPPPSTRPHARKGGMGTAPHTAPPGWISADTPLPVSGRRQTCRVP